MKNYELVVSQNCRTAIMIHNVTINKAYHFVLFLSVGVDFIHLRNTVIYLNIQIF